MLLECIHFHICISVDKRFKRSSNITKNINKKWYIKGKPLDTELDLSEDINNHLIDKNKIEFKKNKGSSENLANFMPYLRSKVRRN